MKRVKYSYLQIITLLYRETENEYISSLNRKKSIEDSRATENVTGNRLKDIKHRLLMERQKKAEEELERNNV